MCPPPAVAAFPGVALTFQATAATQVENRHRAGRWQPPPRCSPRGGRTAMPAARAWPLRAALLCALLCAHGGLPSQAGSLDLGPLCVWDFSYHQPQPPGAKARDAGAEAFSSCRHVALGRVNLWPLEGECKELEQCDKCIEGEASRNITDCVWMRCQESPEKPGTGSCVRKGEPAKEKCLFFNVTKMCEAPQTPTPTTEHSPTTTKAPPKPQTKEPEIHTPGKCASTPPLTGTPEYRPPGFDSASFIGGIVLVLSLQAVIFFVVKFLRSKDNTYQTL
ncbi:CD164 sialomucin-like 2 protein [Varanus komodoensis]|uniref:CD164 sialomucin-like 2 protein n=1 Tax=Varanus komodoensis TaxID=61221 RepID=UPI001CF77431|nr:CD164 sialomucin-like 2 protein [Varanus komodoensis]